MQENKTAIMYKKAASQSLRIRSPHANDVLSGRGGGVNAHVGNKVFRGWVRERKDKYNLAVTKLEKAEIANEVIALVKNQDPPGRFLQRDPNSRSAQTWWVEIDSVKEMAKTSQALREGAPQIRAAHSDELIKRQRRTKRKQSTSVATPLPKVPSHQEAEEPTQQQTIRRLSSAATNAAALRTLKRNVQEAKARAEQQHQNQQLAPPLMSNREFEEMYGPRNIKKRRFDEKLSYLSETPPLIPHPHNQSEHVPKSLDLPPSPASSKNFLSRTHSLALSDFSHGEIPDLNEDFVNPFADESDILDVSKTNNQRPGSRGLDSRYVGTTFCDCKSGKCICADLADHLLHREGLNLFLHHLDK